MMSVSPVRPQALLRLTIGCGGLLVTLLLTWLLHG